MNRTKSLLLTVVMTVFLLSGVMPEAEAARGRTAAAESSPTLDHCTWDKPGQNPYMGDVVGAVDRYTDIAPDVRQRLRARMVRRDYDDVVTIRRDSIVGRTAYDSTIRDMHFGTRQMCRSVSRAGWDANSKERGLVYCESGQCILVPTVCRNVSRIARQEPTTKRAEVAEAPLLDAAFGEVPALPNVPTASLSKAEGAVLIASETTFAGGAGLPAGGFDGEGNGGSTGGFIGTGGGGGGGVIGGGGGRGGLGGGGGGVGVGGNGGGGVTAPALPVTPVPEPETWALMLAGLTSCALMARRTRRARRHG